MLRSEATARSRAFFSEASPSGFRLGSAARNRDTCDSCACSGRRQWEWTPFNAAWASYSGTSLRAKELRKRAMPSAVQIRMRAHGPQPALSGASTEACMFCSPACPPARPSTHATYAAHPPG